MLVKVVRRIQLKVGIEFPSTEKFQGDNFMDRKANSVRQQTITTNKNENPIENLICSQEDNPGGHISPREVGKNIGTNRASIRRIAKRRGLKPFKPLKTTIMSSTTQERRAKRAGALANRFGKSRSVKKCVSEDEKDFALDVLLNFKNSRVYGFKIIAWSITLMKSRKR